ncbi:MAG: NFACT family protein [Clostridia bacterium]|nr:NFACT family protein [Clostridia bacterium]
MPFDGIVLSGAVWEINGLLEGGRIERVFQTGRYEITLLCHSHGEKYRLLISANPENPRIHLTKSKKENPLVAPPFAMVLRKHIQSGKILSLTQEGYDRIVTLTIETHNEMGDIVNKKLIAEIMGKYSNIILTSENGIIYDSVKRVDEDMSSVREVMPGRHYVFPPEQEKIKPEEFKELSAECIEENELPVSKLILKRIFGFSPMLCKAICQNATVVQNKKFKDLSAEEINALNKVILFCCNNISNRNFKPCIIADGKDFHCTDVVLKSAEQNNENIKKYNTVNLMLDDFYTKKDSDDRLKQKQSSIMKHVNSAIEKCRRKMQIHSSTAEETGDYEKYKQFGEILTANMYQYSEYEEKVKAINYYEESMPEITIDLDKNKSVSQNAQNFFKKYRKNKTAHESAEKYLEECFGELEYLESVSVMIANNTDVTEIDEIRRELTDEGYIKQEKMRKNPKKRQESNPVSMPHEYRTNDGYTILIGKNNLQNEKLTCKTAKPDDVWFHLKNAPGSHVILRTAEHSGQVTAHSVECAASLAAWYSSARNTNKADVDYTRVKHVKKQPGGRPGMVNYVNYKTITIHPNDAPEGKA